jgi:hypothetical protein
MYTDRQILNTLDELRSRIVLDDESSVILGSVEQALTARLRTEKGELEVDPEKLFKLALAHMSLDNEQMDEATTLRYIRGGYAETLIGLLQVRETSRVAKAMEQIANVLHEAQGFGSPNGRLSVNSYPMKD